MNRADVPEATIDEHRHSSRTEQDVGAEALPRDRRAIEPVPQTASMKLPTETQLGIRVPSALTDEAAPRCFVEGLDSPGHPRHLTPGRGHPRTLAHRIGTVRHMSTKAEPPEEKRVVGLFAGIGGIELGLAKAGFETSLLCEIDPGAAAVLRNKFPRTPIVPDVREIETLPPCEVVTAGFPCQDLSQAGRTAGIRGQRSGLVDEVLRLIDETPPDTPEWVVLENVPFMLHLERGAAMRHLVDEFARRGFRWAYRVVDARAFGVPQRRRRVLFVASRIHDPGTVLFGDDVGAPSPSSEHGKACGFYWTEGNRGLGWAVDAVPTLKGGSTLGIPSPPAVWLPDGRIITPEIRDAERLQGFTPDWTLPAVEDAGLRLGARWKLVGNAVCVPMARWLGGRLSNPCVLADPKTKPLVGIPWPLAAMGDADGMAAVDVSEWPIRRVVQPLADFLRFEPRRLSQRAALGFSSRLFNSQLRYSDEFARALRSHLDQPMLSDTLFVSSPEPRDRLESGRHGGNALSVSRPDRVGPNVQE